MSTASQLTPILQKSKQLALKSDTSDSESLSFRQNRRQIEKLSTRISQSQQKQEITENVQNKQTYNDPNKNDVYLEFSPRNPNGRCTCDQQLNLVTDRSLK